MGKVTIIPAFLLEIQDPCEDEPWWVVSDFEHYVVSFQCPHCSDEYIKKFTWHGYPELHPIAILRCRQTQDLYIVENWF